MEQGGDGQGRQTAQDARGQPDHRQLAEHHREQPGPGPAQAGEHAEFLTSAADRGGGRVGHEQGAHHQDEDEQQHALLVDRGEDGHRDALFHPALMQGQGGLPVPARCERDGGGSGR